MARLLLLGALALLAVASIGAMGWNATRLLSGKGGTDVPAVSRRKSIVSAVAAMCGALALSLFLSSAHAVPPPRTFAVGLAAVLLAVACGAAGWMVWRLTTDPAFFVFDPRSWRVLPLFVGAAISGLLLWWLSLYLK